MLTVVIISCGEAKIWKINPSAGPTPAKDVYISSYFRLNRMYAEKFGDEWFILSAKYGFIEPDFIIPRNYNVTFKKKSTNPISIEELQAQVRKKRLDRFERIVVLGGSDYAQKIRAAFVRLQRNVITPVKGYSIGRIMKKVKKAILTEQMF